MASIRKRFAGISRVGGAILALVVAAPTTVWASGFSSQSFPVPISVDGVRVRSSLLLQFEIERYGVPFEAFASGQLDNFEAAFRDFVLALRAGDSAKVAALRPGDSEKEVREIINRFHGAFAGPQAIKVVCRIHVGGGQLFVWEWPAPKGPFRRGFTVELSANGTTRVEIVYSGRPLETLIVDVLQQEAVHPREYAAVDSRARYDFIFPLAGPVKPGAHQVILHFNGEPLAVDLFSGEPGKASERPTSGTGSDAALAAYRAAYRALKDRDIDRFCGSYTQTSGDKLRAWFKKMKPDEFNHYYDATTRPRVLRFLLDADPVALVFYTVGSDPQLHYEYLVRDDRGYKLANAYYEGFLDDVLGNAALFPTRIESFVKSVLGGNRSG